MPVQGIEAQTLANVYLALEQDLEIIPVINKIDLPAARPDEVAQEVENLLGVPAEDILRISAKQGIGMQDVLEAVVKRVPPPRGDLDAPLRALVFDSHYDSYKGVVAYVRVVDGTMTTSDHAAADGDRCQVRAGRDRHLQPEHEARSSR